MSNAEILHAYRSLYRATLRAIHFSKPARFELRDTIRTSFRTEPSSNFSQKRVANTLEFLARAEKDTGMEHKILKNLLHVKYWRRNRVTGRTMVNQQTKLAAHVRKTIYAHFDHTVGMLNETLGLCLR